METLILLAIVLYWLPTIVAVQRGHNAALAISVLNLFAGWSGVGWLISLVWACTGDVKNRTLCVVNGHLVAALPLKKDFWARFDRN